MISIKTLRNRYAAKRRYGDTPDEIIVDFLRLINHKNVPEPIREQWLTVQMALREIEHALAPPPKGKCHCHPTLGEQRRNA